jgi:hypothetical protein
LSQLAREAAIPRASGIQKIFLNDFIGHTQQLAFANKADHRQHREIIGATCPTVPHEMAGVPPSPNAESLGEVEIRFPAINSRSPAMAAVFQQDSAKA